MSTVADMKQRLSLVFPNQQATVLAEVISDAYNDLVKTSDFSELKAIVKELTVAQQRTEQRVEELAVAQQRTEQRVEELAVAQQRTEQRVEELAVAQQRTEQRMGELAVAQQHTEQQVAQLSSDIRLLTEEHSKTRKNLGGLSITVGYTLENKAYKALPRLLQRDFDLIVQGRLRRDYVTDSNGNHLEVNIIGTALRNGETVTIIGESKVQLSINDVNRFLKKRVARLEAVIPTMFPLLITHMTSGPDVEPYLRQKGIALYYSYDF